MILKRVKMILFLTIILEISGSVVWSMPASSDNSNGNTVTINDEATPYPFTEKRFVDLSYIAPEVSSMIQNSNLNIEQIRQQQDRLRNRHETAPSSTEPSIVDSENIEEGFRLANIQSALQATLRDPIVDQEVSREERKSEDKPSFEYAFPAVCEMPKFMNYSDWFGKKSWNIIFKPIYRRFNVQSSILRIYKINKDQAKSSTNECSEDVNDLLTIKVSVYMRKESGNQATKIFTTKVIHSALIPSKRTGWVEIDLYATLKYWKKSRNNYGLSIDVYDEKDQQLDAREYFELQNCNQEAESTIPWRAFKLLASLQQSSLHEPVSASVLEQLRKMYPYPRLDILSSTRSQSNSVEILSSEEDVERPYRRVNRLQRHIRHNHRSLLNEHRFSVDKLVSALSSKTHKRRGHISDNGTIGDT